MPWGEACSNELCGALASVVGEGGWAGRGGGGDGRSCVDGSATGPTRTALVRPISPASRSHTLLAASCSHYSRRITHPPNLRPLSLLHEDLLVGLLARQGQMLVVPLGPVLSVLLGSGSNGAGDERRRRSRLLLRRVGRERGRRRRGGTVGEVGVQQDCGGDEERARGPLCVEEGCRERALASARGRGEGVRASR